MSFVWIEAPRKGKPKDKDILLFVDKEQEEIKDLPRRHWLGETPTRIHVDNTNPFQAIIEIYQSGPTLGQIAQALMGIYPNPPETYDILPGEIIKLPGEFTAVKTRLR